MSTWAPPTWDPPVINDGVRILVVDDEELIRRGLCRILTKEGYECQEASNAAGARSVLDRESIDLMLCDVMMPDESGFSLLGDTHERHPDLAVLMVTGVNDPRAAVPASRNGAYGYILKPFDASTIIINVATALERRAEHLAEHAVRVHLETEMQRRGAEIGEARQRVAETELALSGSQEDAVLRLAQAAEWRDPCTGSHIRRMSDSAARLGRLAGLPAEKVEVLRLACLLHDIGKIAIPDDILTKPGALTPAERLIIESHCEIGAQILSGSNSPLLQLASMVALTHHERFDGKGYPRGLVARDIPFEGRIAAIADVYDALRTARPYKKAFSEDRAVATMREMSAAFDPELLELFLDNLPGQEETPPEYG